MIHFERLLTMSLVAVVLQFGIVQFATALVDANTQVAVDCSANTQLSKEQCETLVNFYLKTGGDNWSDRHTNNWLVHGRPCDWEGVVCDGDKVIRLERPGKGLKGVLPDLTPLTHLTQLALFDNPNLSGPLPDLTYLNQLNKLMVFNSGLGGFLPDVRHLPQLTDLIAHNSNFIGPIPDLSHVSNYSLAGNPLCLSPQIDYASFGTIVADYPLCHPMLVDLLDGKLDVTQFGAIADDGKNDHRAINHALSQLQLSMPAGEKLSHLTLYFPAGTYHVEESIALKGFHRLLVSGEINEPLLSRLVKGANFGNNSNGRIKRGRQGAIFDFGFGYGLEIRYLHFQGQTSDITSSYRWWDHGIHVGSTQQITVSGNHFRHFGDAALVIATDPDDQSGEIGCAYSVVSNNEFYNITQTSTTSEKGGCRDYHFLGNSVEHLKGAIKFATRKEGATRLHIANNNIVSAGMGSGIASNNGFEIEGYTNVNIRNNTLCRGDGVGIVVRSVQKGSELAYDWGHINIVGNTITEYKKGIYVANLPHLNNGSLATAAQIAISNNQLINMWNGNNEAAIHLVGSQFESSRVTHNTIVNGTYAVWPEAGQEKGILVENNTLE